MSYLWDCGRNVKFSRDDGQICALNYENLCDIEYLSKLFVSETHVEPNELSTHPWLLTPDLPEDILLFSENDNVGLEFIYKRALLDDSSHGRLLDNHADVILRQIKVFAHIGRMIVSKCKNTDQTSLLLDEAALRISHSDSYSRNFYFLPDALTCALQVLKDSSKKSFSRTTLNSIISLISEIFQGSNCDGSPGDKMFMISPMHAHLLRYSLCEGMRPDLTSRESGTCKNLDQEVVQSLQLAMSCALCLFRLGLYTHSSSDVLLAMSHMLAVTVCIEDFRDAVDEHITSRDSDIPTSEQNRMKAKLRDNRFNVKKKALVPPQGNEQTPDSEAVSGFDIKMGPEKSSWEKPILKSATGKGWKSKLQIKKTSMNLRPERDHTVTTKQGTRMGVSVSPAADMPTVLSWRCTIDSDHFSKKVRTSLHSKSSTPTKNLNFRNPLPQAVVDPRVVRRKANESLENLNIIPKDVVKEVGKLCVASREISVSSSLGSKPLSNSSRCLSTTAIWTCGQNSYGELGHGDVNLRRSFAKCMYFDDKSVSCVGAGNEHSVFISSSGKTYVAGYNDNGQCGIGTTQQVRQPTVVSFLEDEDISNVFVFNGCEHTLVVTTEGKMFSFGYNYRGQLGVGNTCSEPVPRPIGGLMSRKVALAACSYHHSIVTCVDGSVFSFGRNDCGQLGHGDTTDKKVPSLVQGLPCSVVSLSCGQFHTIIVTKSGTALACGKNDYGQLGLESSENSKYFSIISTCPEENSMLQVCCGYYHSLLLTQSGGVFGFGRNDYGQLGLGHTQPRMYGVTPNLYLRDKNVLSLAAGCYHSVAVTTNGMLYVFGRNNHGQLGTGDIDERHFPHPVDDFIGKTILQVAAGFYHTIVLLATASNQENGFEASGKQTDLLEMVSSRHILQKDSVREKCQQPNSDENLDGSPESSRDLPNHTEQPPSNNNRDLSSKVSDCLDGMNVEFRDLFVFTMRHLQQSVDVNNVRDPSGNKFWSTDMRIEDSLVGLNWASLQMSTFTVLLQMCRQYLNGSLAIEIPFTQEEILSTLCSLVNLFEEFALSFECSYMIEICQLAKHCQDDEIISEALAQYSPSFPVFNFEYIVEKLTTTSNYVSSSKGNGGKTIHDEMNSARALLVESIRNIRQELLFVYFYSSEAFEISPLISHQCAVIISKNFDFLFWSQNLKISFFAFISEAMTEAPPASVDLFDTTFTSMSVEMDAVDYSRCVNLLTKVCVKYRNLSEVIDIFRQSSIRGLEIYHKIMRIYNHLSIVRVKNACDDIVYRYDVHEFDRIINLLEHCCAHFTKCAVPLIFAADPNDTLGPRDCEEREQDSTFTVGSLVIESLFSTAETIIDSLLACCNVDDSKVVINNDSNLPIILPTFLLYALSNVEVSHSRFQISPYVTRLIGKLQYLISSLDLDSGTASRNPSTPKKRMEEIQSLSRGASDTSTQKKEFVQTPWWVRLLKLCSILSAKLSSVLISDETFESKERECVSLSSLLVWKYWAGPEQIVKFHQLMNIEDVKMQVDDNIVEFRRVAFLINNTYRTIISAATANNTIGALSGIESCLISAVQRACLWKKLNSTDVQSISTITTHIFNQRALLMSRCGGLRWKEMLHMIYRVVRSFNIVLESCIDASSVRPLLIARQKPIHPALRRTLLIVMCLNRWKWCLKNKFKLRKFSVINAFQHVLDRTVFTIQPFDENSLVAAWKGVLRDLQMSNSSLCNQASGMTAMSNLLLETPQSSIRIDTMSLLTASWKKKIQKSISKQNALDFDKSLVIGVGVHEFSTQYAKCQHRLAFLGLMNVVQNSIKEFCEKLCEGSIAIQILFTELNLFYCNVKFMQLVIADKNNPYSFEYSNFTLNHLKDVLVAIDEKFADMQSNDDRSSGGSMKRQSSREKSGFVRRAASAIVRLFQMIAASSYKYGIHMSTLDFKAILDVHFQLIKHFQSIRLVQRADNIAVQQNEAKDSRGKDVNSHRRRCQELIVNPMQFGRIQEGFVVQGEKLLSNFKGIDFTLACWIFITKKTVSRSSFLVGKVSHNDAWPLLTLRAADMKAEIIFGRANEFERLSSHASIQMHTWTHIAVVVEPRKIKLFINGSMDCQVTTAGNARAILYPVIIGACPSGVRTRVDCIKEGFDGLLANLKYYTRALSPIHVRVIFDKGPPEAHDARENLSFHLLASSTLMLNSRKLLQSRKLCQTVLETFHFLFLSDSSRLRLGSLKVLQKILILHICEDFPLSQNELFCNSRKQREKPVNSAKGESVSLMTAEFLGHFVSFEERVVFYFVRLMGLCWCPGTKEKKNTSNLRFMAISPDTECGRDRVQDFLSYCPSFVAPSPPTSDPHADCSGVTNEGGAIEVPIPREDLIVEMCQAINDMLRHLSHIEAWQQAISQVLCRCSSTYLNQTSGEFTLADIFGVAVFIGDLPLCPYVGAVARSSYLKYPGTILSIDKATCQSTLLTFNNLKDDIQFVTVKTTELRGVSDVNDSLQLSEDFTISMIAMMKRLSSDAASVMTDCLSISRRDQSFAYDYVLKSCHPCEVFLFHQFLRRVSHSSDSCHLTQDLYDILRVFSIRATNNDTYCKLTREVGDCQVPFMWIRSLNFVDTLFSDEGVCDQQRKVNNDEDDLCESVLSTHFDISPDSFKSKYSSLLKSGHVTEFIHCASADADADVESLNPVHCGNLIPHAYAFDLTSLASRGDPPNSAAKVFFQMLLELRELIIKYSKQVMHADFFLHAYDCLKPWQLPWKIVMWQSIAKEYDSDVCSRADKDLLGLSSNLQKYDGRHVTSSLIGSINFSLTTLFRRKSCGIFESSDSMLQSTDVFNRLILATFTWLRTLNNFPEECSVCYNIVSAFLPLIEVIRGMECELDIMSLCAMAIHRIVVLSCCGYKPSDEITNFVRTDVFSSIWARTQEQLVLERGQSKCNFSPLTQQIASIAASFSILQRCNGNVPGTCSGSDCINIQDTDLSISNEVGNILLPPIVVRSARSHSVELDISFAHKLELKMAEFTVQVVICVHGDGSTAEVADDSAYETIFCGSATNFVHNGLSPSSLYCVKYRLVSHPLLSNWSEVTEFRTDVGTTPFVFDTMRCGPDIVVSSDGRVASYSGDDNWSTVLGSTPFTSGINSWEVKIVTSSTAYIFVGIASSAADLNTFLGGCADGWGFIGEQALYHGREKVKIYGEPFSAGDVVGVILDFNSGTLSFTRNGKTLGIAFDKIYGELFPAVAFYNVGQEVEIVSDSFRTFCPPVPFPCSPSIVNLDQFSLLSEMMNSLSMRKPFSFRVLDSILTHLKSWCSGNVIRKKAVSGRYVFLKKESKLLNNLELKCGDRVRTQYGIADICGSAYGRVWFQTKDKEGVWYFSKQQIAAGRTKGLFQRCSYKPEDSCVPSEIGMDGSVLADIDIASLHEYLDPERWSCDVDSVLVDFLHDTAEKENVSPWDISSRTVCDNFRKIQLNFSRHVLDSVELSHKWGIMGPKRKAVLARLGVIRLYNHLLEHSLPLLLPSVMFGTPDPKLLSEELSFTSVSTPNFESESFSAKISGETFMKKVSFANGCVSWPIYCFSWESKKDSRLRQVPIPNCSPNGHLCVMTRKIIFSNLKRSHFWKILQSSTARVSKTDDDYDYPEDLPLVKLNRFKSFRAVEVAEQMNISGDDMILSSMFCQLWKELRQHAAEKLRISYTHPMDDGQSRTFKVRFEGEGVDDYGGPYREVFQKICEELKILGPDIKSETSRKFASCFLPILHPTPNWSAEDCVERYKYTFLPSSSSTLSIDLFNFLGQLVGIALRSKITVELPLASFIWKSVVREPLSNSDIASFDAPASRFVEYIGSMYKKISDVTLTSYQEESIGSLTEELETVLQDVTWTVCFSDGVSNNLIEDGHLKHVHLKDVGKYLELYTEARLGECFTAVEAFREGLLWVVPESAISILTWDELEYLVCGSKCIDVDRLKKNTEYDDDVSPNDKHIINFWEILDCFSEKEKSSFLRFVWARPTLPPNGIDFPQKLKIQSAVGDDPSSSPDSYLPKAHTCFFSINLPRYSTKDVMKERLLYAITHCTEMDADFRVTEEEVVGWASLPAAQNWTSYAGTE